MMGRLLLVACVAVGAVKMGGFWQNRADNSDEFDARLDQIYAEQQDKKSGVDAEAEMFLHETEDPEQIRETNARIDDDNEVSAYEHEGEETEAEKDQDEVADDLGADDENDAADLDMTSFIQLKHDNDQADGEGVESALEDLGGYEFLEGDDHEDYQKQVAKMDKDDHQDAEDDAEDDAADEQTQQDEQDALEDLRDNQEMQLNREDDQRAEDDAVVNHGVEELEEEEKKDVGEEVYVKAKEQAAADVAKDPKIQKRLQILKDEEDQKENEADDASMQE